LEIRTLDELKLLAERLNAQLSVYQPSNGITIQMPPTKRQKGRGDYLSLGEAHTLEENVQTAYEWIINWEEVWNLRLTVTNQQVKDYIRKRMDEDKQALRAMNLIYNYQTPSEKQSERTEIRNNVGFSGVDAELMTSFQKQLDTRGFLTKKQMQIVRRVMKKYWRQIREASDEKKLLTMVKRAQPESIQTRMNLDA